MTQICIFGDSITWGAGLPFRAGWANLLRNHLECKTKGVMELYDLGIDRDTSRDILARFDVEAKARNPSIIIFAIGINDSCYRKTKDKPLVSIDEFEKNLLKLIKKARKFTDKIIFVGLAKGSDQETKPLLRSTTGKCYDKGNVKIYNSVIGKVSKKENLLFIDIFNKLTDEDFDDGLHPNIGGHIKIFEEVRRNLDKVLN